MQDFLSKNSGISDKTDTKLEGLDESFFLSLWQNDILRLALDSAFKLVLAAVCGGFIGYERQHSHRPAGFRTHILVAVGAALVMITSSFLTDQYQEVMQIDPTRMSAQVISGIGFWAQAPFARGI